MKEIIERNAKQGRMEYLQLIKKRKIKERLLSIFVGAFIIVATCTLIILSSKMTDEAQKSCIEAGHNEKYCEAKL